MPVVENEKEILTQQPQEKSADQKPMVARELLMPRVEAMFRRVSSMGHDVDLYGVVANSLPDLLLSRKDQILDLWWRH